MTDVLARTRLRIPGHRHVAGAALITAKANVVILIRL
jgi:hypothetical protein